MLDIVSCVGDEVYVVEKMGVYYENCRLKFREFWFGVHLPGPSSYIWSVFKIIFPPSRKRMSIVLGFRANTDVGMVCAIMGHCVRWGREKLMRRWMAFVTSPHFEGDGGGPIGGRFAVFVL